MDESKSLNVKTATKRQKKTQKTSKPDGKEPPGDTTAPQASVHEGLSHDADPDVS